MIITITMLLATFAPNFISKIHGIYDNIINIRKAISYTSGFKCYIGGSTTTAAMAIAKGWNKFIGLIILAGIFGYIIGNYLGIFMGKLLRLL